MKNKLKGLVFILLLCVVPLAHAASISIEPKYPTIFDTWLPKAVSPGNTVDLLVSVSGYTHSHGEIQFYFTEVSNWPNTYMNSTETETQQDLKIYDKRGKEQSSQVFLSVADARAGTMASVNTAYLTLYVIFLLTLFCIFDRIVLRFSFYSCSPKTFKRGEGNNVKRTFVESPDSRRTLICRFYGCRFSVLFVACRA